MIDQCPRWPSLPLAGHRVVVTGAASGIGRATALACAEAGADVAVLGSPRGSARVAAVAAQVVERGRQAYGDTVDVSDDAAVKAALDEAASRLGGIDTVVACAGIEVPSGRPSAVRLVDLEAAEVAEVLDVNVRGVWSTVRHAAPHLRESVLFPSAITVASVAARRPSHGVYSVSKAAVWMATRVLALELAGAGIRVNCLAPGFIDTPLLQRAAAGMNGDDGTDLTPQAARVPLGRVGDPAEVAMAVVFLASALSSYFSGAFLNPDGGLVNVNAGG